MFRCTIHYINSRHNIWVFDSQSIHSSVETSGPVRVWDSTHPSEVPTSIITESWPARGTGGGRWTGWEAWHLVGLCSTTRCHCPTLNSPQILNQISWKHSHRLLDSWHLDLIASTFLDPFLQRVHTTIYRRLHPCLATCQVLDLTSDVECELHICPRQWAQARYSFSFDHELMNTCYMPDPVLRAEDSEKRGTFPALESSQQTCITITWWEGTGMRDSMPGTERSPQACLG